MSSMSNQVHVDHIVKHILTSKKISPEKIVALSHVITALSLTREEALLHIASAPRRMGIQMISDPKIAKDLQFPEEVIQGGAFSASVRGVRNILGGFTEVLSPTPKIFINKALFSKSNTNMRLTEKEFNKVFPIIQLHETSEIHHGVRQFKARGNTLKISSHQSMAVVADEMLAAASAGPEYYQAMKKFRLFEADFLYQISKGKEIEYKENIAKTIKSTYSLGKIFLPKRMQSFLEQQVEKPLAAMEKISSEVMKATPQYKAYDYQRKVRKLVATFEKKMIPRFQKESPAWNPIEGMQHGGEAEKLRKKITDFSSPVDLLKAVTRARRLYEMLARGHMKRLGIKADEFTWLTWLNKITQSSEGHTLQVIAKQGDRGVFEIKRTFQDKAVGLENIYITEKLQGKGLGSSIYKAEPDLFKLLGYEAGETVYSPMVISDTTERWIKKQYAGKVIEETLGGYKSMKGKIPLTPKLEVGHKLAVKQHSVYGQNPGKRHTGKAGKIIMGV